MRVPGVDFQDGRNTVFLQFEVIFDAPGRARIAAGSLVSVGILLGVLVNPWFFGLSAFVGAGLVFAGVTDTCGMGMILAHMPWNNERPAAKCVDFMGASLHYGDRWRHGCASKQTSWQSATAVSFTGRLLSVGCHYCLDHVATSGQYPRESQRPAFQLPK